MVFSSVTFVLVFLPLVLCIYLLIYLHSVRAQYFTWCNAFILLASLLFYAWGEPQYVIIIVASSLINFHIAKLLDFKRGLLSTSRSRTVTLGVGVAINICILAYFKYMNFFVDNGLINALAFILPQSLSVMQIAHIALPLGISFYTFQGISYIVDVYRHDAPASRNIIDFSCYLTMFPQLVAGPIVRYTTIAEELNKRTITLTSFSSGIQRFILGLAKKLLIADTMGRVAKQAFDIPVEELSLLAAWAGMVCYTLQIYYDFSGYSDMAIGLGKMFGFTFPENFNYPYISKSIKEFWRRWHITLSTWFKDYLYIPLGGNRYGELRTVINLLIVFLLCGFWHGASWIFIFWGLYHGSFLVLERLFPSFPECLPKPLQHGYALAVIMVGWVLFAAKDLPHALGYLKGLLGFQQIGVQTNRVWVELFAGDVYIALFLGLLFALPIAQWVSRWWDDFSQRGNAILVCTSHALWLATILLLFVICLMPLFGSTFNAFIYFRF